MVLKNSRLVKHSVFLRAVKAAANLFLNRIGLEVIFQNKMSTMNSSLEWLASRGFQINTVLDVGASDGRWSKECMRSFPGSNYILFEPNPIHHEMLNNFQEEFEKSVEVVRSAVGGSDGTVFFDVSEPLGGGLNASPESTSIHCPMTTIDRAVSLSEFDGPYLLKLDTHGFERVILEGAKGTLPECEVLIIEAYNFYIEPEAILFWQLCDLLDGFGFRVIDCVDIMHRLHDGAFWQMDMVFVKRDWKGFSYINYL